MSAELYFGRSLPDGGLIGDAAWQDFLATIVTPRFPDGLTVLEGRGQWRQRSTGVVSAEPASLVIIVTEESDETLALLDQIRATYRERFHQESVGLVTTPSCASF